MFKFWCWILMVHQWIEYTGVWLPAGVRTKHEPGYFFLQKKVRSKKAVSRDGGSEAGRVILNGYKEYLINSVYQN